MFRRRILTVGCILLMLIITLCGCKTQPEFSTDTKPIYNHFPNLPKTDKISWYNETLEGIGPTTVKLYVFAQYETSEQLNEFLQNIDIASETSTIEAKYLPDAIDSNNIWYELQNVPFCFQEEGPNTMNTKVYVNDTHTVLFMYAIG